MNRSKVAFGGVAGALAIAILWFVFGPKPSDDAQIKQALQSALKASKEGRPGGVVEYLSSDVVVNGEHYHVNRQFTGFIRKYHPDITVGAMKPVVNGDTASLTSDIQFTVFNKTIALPNVTFTFKKQNDTKWLIFPSKDWKVTGATAPSEGYEQLIGELAIDGSFASGSSLW